MSEFFSGIVIVVVVLAALVGTGRGEDLLWLFHDLFDLFMLGCRKLGFKFAKDYRSAYDQMAEAPKDHLLGLTAQVVIPFVQSEDKAAFEGKIRCDGAYWRAKSNDQRILNLKKGDKVDVKGRADMVLLVGVKG